MRGLHVGNVRAKREANTASRTLILAFLDLKTPYSAIPCHNFIWQLFIYTLIAFSLGYWEIKQDKTQNIVFYLCV
jgi:hypothetical protein